MDPLQQRGQLVEALPPLQLAELSPQVSAQLQAILDQLETELIRPSFPLHCSHLPQTGQVLDLLPSPAVPAHLSSQPALLFRTPSMPELQQFLGFNSTSSSSQAPRRVSFPKAFDEQYLLQHAGQKRGRGRPPGSPSNHKKKATAEPESASRFDATTKDEETIREETRTAEPACAATSTDIC